MNNRRESTLYTTSPVGRISTVQSSPAGLTINVSENNPVASITRLVTTSAINCTAYTQFEAEELRYNYLVLINRENWKEGILEVARALKATFSTQIQATGGSGGGAQSTSESNDYTVKYGGEIFTFPANQEVITIGRKDGCDIQLDENDTTASRLHLVIFILDDRVLLVDPGSLMGVKTERRGRRSQRLQHSLPHLRQVLQFDRHESYVLSLGGQRLVGVPKTCVICETNPREFLNNCGHFIMCRGCSDRVIDRGNNQCPICRKPVSGDRARLADMLKTFVHSDSAQTGFD